MSPAAPLPPNTGPEIDLNFLRALAKPIMQEATASMPHLVNQGIDAAKQEFAIIAQNFETRLGIVENRFTAQAANTTGVVAARAKTDVVGQRIYLSILISGLVLVGTVIMAGYVSGSPNAAKVVDGTWGLFGAAIVAIILHAVAGAIGVQDDGDGNYHGVRR